MVRLTCQPSHERVHGETGSARQELRKIREDHFVRFTPICFTMNALLIWLAREAHHQRWTRCGIDLDEVDAEEDGYTGYTYNGKGWEVVYKIPVYTRGYHITYLQVYII